MSTDGTVHPVKTLDKAVVWELLEKHPYGRLATEAAGLVDIFPVNYVAHQNKLYFRTAQGSKLSSLVVNDQVAFEIDEVSPENVVRSVVVHGRARRLETRAEIEAAEELPLKPWAPTLKYNFVVIDVESATGREFTIGEEPERCPV
ncbi:pyridoxamine 5'-phosphate oxidase family protein [Kocuria flava]|uniref:pyridoxamine 5'-phosphate oxidase family protein n=1 Tax=Kocuria flava TaxID=446860 RepID=UPI001FF4708C|nr:pyridoxamine 5'-phosphate oxidase family protein [Kocuria flava]MCJ8503596.1 pyridoxamine 5'-phosphate oxidase family protein [Kocuria flava]